MELICGIIRILLGEVTLLGFWYLVHLMAWYGQFFLMCNVPLCDVTVLLMDMGASSFVYY